VGARVSRNGVSLKLDNYNATREGGAGMSYEEREEAGGEYVSEQAGEMLQAGNFDDDIADMIREGRFDDVLTELIADGSMDALIAGRVRIVALALDDMEACG